MSLNLATILRQGAQRWPARTALTLGDTKLSYAALHDQARRFAGGLRGLGIERGRHVALFLPNVPHFSIAYFGALYAACPSVPLNVLQTAEEIAYHLADSDAVAIVTWERFLPQVVEALPRAPQCKHLIVARPAIGDPVPAPPESIEFSSLVAGATPVADLPATMPDDTATLLYTSGTTGRPKGAELTHANLYFNLHTVGAHLLPLGPETIALTCLPLFHIFGQQLMHNCVLHAGGEIVLCPRFEPRTVCELIQRHHVSYFCGVPSMYFALLHHPDARGFDLSSLKVCGSGGSSLPVEVMRAFEERHGIGIIEGYGLSETSPIAIFNSYHAPRRPGSIGLPIPGVEIRLVAGDGRIVTAPDEPGEILISGPSVMKGYYRRPEETRAVLDEGWLRTGDVGVRDADGYYRIVDRLKDLIIRGGLNVYPREVEEVLYAHPAVAEAAVIGVPDDAQGEEVKAIVVLKPGATATAQDLISYCRERVALYKFPRTVEFRDSLPKGPSGKILKKALRAQGSAS